MLRQAFIDFIFTTNTDGSGKAASYVRVLDMLGLVHYPKPIVGGSVWRSFSLADIHAVLTRVPWGHRMLIIGKCPQAASHLLLLHPEVSRSTNSGVFTLHLQPNMCEMSSLNLL